MCRSFFLLTSFQDDKDLVHEFVVAEGLTCLIKVGAEADQNYQNYILRGTSAYKFPPRFLTPQFTAATAKPVGVGGVLGQEGHQSALSHTLPPIKPSGTTCVYILSM